MVRACVLLLAFLALGCSTSSPDRWLLAKYGKESRISGFAVCKNFGCKKRVPVAFDGAEWARVRDIFEGPPASPAGERERIGLAIALMERIVGPKAGTQGDEAGAPLISAITEGQLDCIDETYNTTTYLRLIASDGLLAWHDVGEPYQRGGLASGRVHNTATIVERGSNTAYTVDSWFHANGQAPEVVLLADWLSGWSPAEA
jgi:hypothetical protein